MNTIPECCDLHRPDGCCDPNDCGPCCSNCPTCPTLLRGQLQDARADYEALQEECARYRRWWIDATERAAKADQDRNRAEIRAAAWCAAAKKLAGADKNRDNEEHENFVLCLSARAEEPRFRCEGHDGHDGPHHALRWTVTW